MSLLYFFIVFHLNFNTFLIFIIFSFQLLIVLHLNIYYYSLVIHQNLILNLLPQLQYPFHPIQQLNQHQYQFKFLYLYLYFIIIIYSYFLFSHFFYFIFFFLLIFIFPIYFYLQLKLVTNCLEFHHQYLNFINIQVIDVLYQHIYQIYLLFFY